MKTNEVRDRLAVFIQIIGSLSYQGNGTWGKDCSAPQLKRLANGVRQISKKPSVAGGQKPIENLHTHCGRRVSTTHNLDEPWSTTYASLFDQLLCAALFSGNTVWRSTGGARWGGGASSNKYGDVLGILHAIILVVKN